MPTKEDNKLRTQAHGFPQAPCFPLPRRARSSSSSLSAARGRARSGRLMKFDSFELRTDAVYSLIREYTYCQNNYKSQSLCSYQPIDFFTGLEYPNKKHRLSDGPATTGTKAQFHQVSIILPVRNLMPLCSGKMPVTEKCLLVKTSRKQTEERVMFLLTFERKERTSQLLLCSERSLGETILTRHQPFLPRRPFFCSHLYRTPHPQPGTRCSIL